MNKKYNPITNWHNPLYLLRDCLVVSFLLCTPFVIIVSGCNQAPATIPPPSYCEAIDIKLNGLEITLESTIKRIVELERPGNHHSHPTVLHEHIHPVVTEQEKRIKELEEYRGAPEVLISELADRVKALKDKLEALEFGINITNSRIDDLEEFGHPSKRPRTRHYKSYDKKPTFAPKRKLKATITPIKEEPKERSIVTKRTKGFPDCPEYRTPLKKPIRKPSYFPVPPRKPITQTHKHPWEFLIPTLEKRIIELERKTMFILRTAYRNEQTGRFIVTDNGHWQPNRPIAKRTHNITIDGLKILTDSPAPPIPLQKVE